MARSSGGGSRSGGSRSSSSSSSSSSSYSSSYSSGRSYSGYYGGYSSGSHFELPLWARIIIAVLAFIITFVVVALLYGGITIPTTKPLESYKPYKVGVVDKADVFNQQEEELLAQKLEEFGDATGITTKILTVTKDEWIDNGSFEDFAFYMYYAYFGDENNWILVYSEEDEGKGEWHWEGVQGDNTIEIMDVFLDDFNNTFHANLVVDQTADPAKAFLASFDRALDVYYNQEITFDSEGLIYAIVFAFIVAAFAFS
jgi:hypothetical protein